LKLQNEEPARERKEAKLSKGRRGRKRAPETTAKPAGEGVQAPTATAIKAKPKRRAPVRRKPRKKAVVESSSESASSSSSSSSESESSQYESD
jgi:hypothetical protein